MDAFVIVALIGFALLFFELLLPTGGVLAALGIAGVVAAGVLALGSDSDGAGIIGPALITLGILSGITFYYVTRKVIAAHQHQPVRAGTEQLIGAVAEARSTIDPEGQVWLEGTLWSARLASEGAPAHLGDRVRVEAVDGLTLVVSPEPEPAEQAKEGVS